MKAIDVMGFAGSMAAGVDQAGFDIIAKREPAKFGGFGMNSVLYNMPWVEGQVAAPEDWAPPPEQVELVYGCPPCSGFSALSIINTSVHGTVYGIDDPINECMTWFADYTAKVKPQVAIMESVALAHRNGLPWLEHIADRIKTGSGIDYYITHVVMNAALVGGDVIRPRYFLVASQAPFGVGLEFVQPRTMGEVIADLEFDVPQMGWDDDATTDTDWGHVMAKGAGIRRNVDTIKFLRTQGMDWLEGTRLPDNLPPEWLEHPESMPEEMIRLWTKPRPTRSKRYGGEDGMTPWYSHLFSTDAFSPVMWRSGKPYGVVVAATLFRALRYGVAPDVSRNLTYREAARFMSIPDTWSLRWLVEKDAAAELGKAVPAASAKWIAHWARMSIEGTPGEYAGRALSPDPMIRTIDVRNPNLVADIIKGTGPGTELDGFWETTVDPSPSTWLIDRKARPREWWQREDELGLFVPSGKPAKERAPRKPAEPQPPRAKATESAPAPAARGTIERVRPEVVKGLMDELGLTKAQAAEKLGVSVSRINELTTDRRPGSWLNSERWGEVESALRA